MLDRVAIASSRVPGHTGAAAIGRTAAAGRPAADDGPSGSRSACRPHGACVGVAALQRAIATRRARSPAKATTPARRRCPTQRPTCGIGGKLFCTVATGKGDALEVEPSALKPESPSADDPKLPELPAGALELVLGSRAARREDLDLATKTCEPRT